MISVELLTLFLPCFGRTILDMKFQSSITPHFKVPSLTFLTVLSVVSIRVLTDTFIWLLSQQSHIWVAKCMLLPFHLSVTSRPDSMGLFKSKIAFLFNFAHSKNVWTFVKKFHKTGFIFFAPSQNCYLLSSIC